MQLSDDPWKSKKRKSNLSHHQVLDYTNGQEGFKISSELLKDVCRLKRIS